MANEIMCPVCREALVSYSNVEVGYNGMMWQDSTKFCSYRCAATHCPRKDRHTHANLNTRTEEAFRYAEEPWNWRIWHRIRKTFGWS